MKSVAVVALSVLTLASSLATAEARGFKLRGSILSSSHRPIAAQATTVRRVPAVAAVGAIAQRNVMTAEAQGSIAEDNTPIPPMPPLPETVPVKKAAAPWCPSGRVAGAGSGFCLIN